MRFSLAKKNSVRESVKMCYTLLHSSSVLRVKHNAFCSHVTLRNVSSRSFSPLMNPESSFRAIGPEAVGDSYQQVTPPLLDIFGLSQKSRRLNAFHFLGLRYWDTGGIAGTENFRYLACRLDTGKNSFEVRRSPSKSSANGKGRRETLGHTAGLNRSAQIFGCMASAFSGTLNIKQQYSHSWDNRRGLTAPPNIKRS